MKGKIFNFKVILTMMLVIASSFCFFVGARNQASKTTNKTVALEKVTLNNQEFSALTDGIILSVEKVMVNSTETVYTDDAGKEYGYPNKISSSSGNVKTFLGGYDKLLKEEYETTAPSGSEPVYADDGTNYDSRRYDFRDMANGTSTKTIVENGSVVRLDNVISSEKVVMPNNSGYQEAIMISFGVYVLADDGTIKIAQNDGDSTVYNKDEAITSKITDLSVSMTKNGVEQAIPIVRNIGNAQDGLYFDFACLITQETDNSNEGYYLLSFNYMIGGASGRASFEFFILNNSTYTQNINPTGKNYGYNAQPTLGWTGGANFVQDNEVDGYVRYYIGKDGISETEVSYPTITYDYTKYKLTYEHTANQKKTSYDLSVAYKNDGSATLTMTATSSSGKSSTSYVLDDYHKSNLNNLVTIVFTEPGTYKFDYEFLYRGYNAGITPDLSDFETRTLRLAIHGMSAKYSKTDYESANLQYFEFADQNNNNIDLVIPAGYELNSDISDKVEQKLGFVYQIVENASRVGNVVSQNSSDSLINATLKNKNTLDVTNSNDYAYLTTEVGAGVNKKLQILDSVSITSEASNLTEVLKEINYVSTNQGSLWIEGNDKYTTNSFYFYSVSEIQVSDLSKTNNNNTPSDESDDYLESAAEPFTNTTSFNKKGYYLVFMEIDPTGVSDDPNPNYWQIFAFQYSSGSVNIDVQAIKDDGTYSDVVGGKYTNKEVRISWKKPGLFDREIIGYYYTSKNQIKTKDELLLTSQNTLTTTIEPIDDVECCVAKLGDASQVPNGSFVQFLIRLESEGDGATHKTFTIDRQAISGVQPYLIQEMYAGTSVYYAYYTDVNNSIVPITNSITDSYATFEWDEKASGASITATYSYTPFSLVARTDTNVVTMNGNNAKTWVLTNYELGTTIYGSSLVKPTSKSLVSSESILFNQGIYIITLKDDAGNECVYSFVIDRTNGYFNIDGQLISSASVVSGEDVSYNIGDYKAFKLTTTDSDLDEFIKAAATNDYSDVDNYYADVNTTNKTALTKLFQKVEDDYYFTVANTSVQVYDGKVFDEELGTSGKLVYNVDDGASYYKRTLYAEAENNTYSTRLITNGAYATVTINKDNARGSVYYASSQITAVPNEDADNKLDTGSDGKDSLDNDTNGINGGRATSAKNVAFTWIMGSGAFEVATVTYKIYSLSQNNWNGDKYFYYDNGDDPIVAYNNGATNSETKISNGYGLISFNNDSDSKVGLYVVTRTYKDIEDEDAWGEDEQEKNYYFIVDRTGIIQGDVGGSIKIELMEGEAELTKNDFSTQNADDGYLSDVTNGIVNERYYIYLSTTKLPATLNVPVGKYFNVIDNNLRSSAGYSAGKLNVSVYFVNSENQIEGLATDGQICIYDSTNTKYVQYLKNSGKTNILTDGTYEINIYQYLSLVNTTYRDYLTEVTSSTNTDRQEWLFLPGTYVVRISDNVVDTLGNTHTKLIGFKISPNMNDADPKVDNFTGANQTDSGMVKLNSLTTSNEATVSQEYLKVVLPSYDKTNKTKAQVDPSYIEVTQHYNTDTTGKYYLIHDYRPTSGTSLNKASELVTINSDGSINVWLDTKLRVDSADPTSAIDYDNLNTPLYYKITIRYKLNTIDDISNLKLTIEDFERYKNCYIYYTNNTLKSYYETTYTITIDREAPSANITELNKFENDSLLASYMAEYEVDSMFENSVHETGSNLYFTKQYTKYYQADKDKQYIYAYQVTSATTCNFSDVSKLLVSDAISDFKNYELSLPVINESSYTQNEVNSRTTFATLGLTPNNYYEIVEFDAAGNATQYVIHYSPAEPEINIPIKFNLTDSKEPTINVTLGTNEQVTVYGIESAGGVTVANDYFFKIEIFKGKENTPIYSVLTNATTDFASLTEKIVKAMTDEKFGTFTLKIATRTKSSSMTIVLYDSENIIPLDIEDLVVRNGDTVNIDLDNANVWDGEKNVWYFATQIVVKTGDSTRTFTASYDTNGVKYYEGADLVGEISCSTNTTYYIEMTEVSTRTTTYRFNTSGSEFVILEFEDVDNDDADDYYKGIHGTEFVYYGFTTATLRYDNTIYSSEVYLKQADGDYAPSNIKAVLDEKNNVYNIVTITAPAKGLIETKVVLKYLEVPEQTYFITIDTRMSSVALRDYNSGEKRDIITEFSNIAYDDVSVRSDKTGSGFMNLAWNQVEENDYFDYTYTLHELLKDETYKAIDLNAVTNYVIATDELSTGIYKFEIRVYGKDGTYLGNRVHAFEVQEISTQVYYVRDESGVAIQANADFIVGKLAFYSLVQSIFGTINTNLPFDLFITNQDLDVVITATDVTRTSHTFVTTPYTFTIYKISKPNAYDIYFGILKIDEIHQLVQNLQIKAEQTFEVKTSTNFTVSGEPATEVLIMDESISSSDYLLSKNSTYINIYYNGVFIESKPFNNRYEVLGNGQYDFTFTDLAGNVHEFDNDNDGYNVDTVDELKVYVVREVVVLVNDQAPIQNAFYNNEVSLALYASNKYVTGSVTLTAERNGQPYVPAGYNPYIFSGYGNYRITINAEYNNGTKKILLQKVITFTIINVNEARKSIDLTSLKGSTITSVLNSTGQDITSEFLNMMQQSSTNGGLNISYEDIIAYETNSANKEKLNVTSGKMTFTLTYLYEDGIYPARSITLSFTLNNEEASIPCSLTKGDSTTKSFTIYFNPAILYEQVGEAYVYINDKMVAHISETSANTEMRINTSFDNDGDGDYYIKLISSSGVILDSYKVTIKEPLNVWAIIIIIVVVVVVATVVTTIILLRRKMRIR